MAEKRGKTTNFGIDFNNNCLVGDCEGWTAKGQYYSATMHNGKNQLRMRSEVTGPSDIRKREINARWVIGANDGGTEVLNCQWRPKKGSKKKKKRCTSSVSKKSVEKWHGEKKDPFKIKKNAPKLWLDRKLRVKGNRMSFKAVRYYEQPDKYSRWQAGDQLDTFLTFRDGPTDLKIGRSDMIEMFLYEPVEPLKQEPIKMVPLVACLILGGLIAIMLLCLCVTILMKACSKKPAPARDDSAKKLILHESFEDQNTDRSGQVPSLPMIGKLQKVQQWDDMDIPIPEYDIDKPRWLKKDQSQDEESLFREPTKNMINFEVVMSPITNDENNSENKQNLQATDDLPIIEEIEDITSQYKSEEPDYHDTNLVASVVMMHRQFEAVKIVQTSSQDSLHIESEQSKPESETRPQTPPKQPEPIRTPDLLSAARAHMMPRKVDPPADEVEAGRGKSDLLMVASPLLKEQGYSTNDDANNTVIAVEEKPKELSQISDNEFECVETSRKSLESKEKPKTGVSELPEEPSVHNPTFETKSAETCTEN